MSILLLYFAKAQKQQLLLVQLPLIQLILESKLLLMHLYPLGLFQQLQESKSLRLRLLVTPIMLVLLQLYRQSQILTILAMPARYLE